MPRTLLLTTYCFYPAILWEPGLRDHSAVVYMWTALAVVYEWTLRLSLRHFFLSRKGWFVKSKDNVWQKLRYCWSLLLTLTACCSRSTSFSRFLEAEALDVDVRADWVVSEKQICIQSAILDRQWQTKLTLVRSMERLRPEQHFRWLRPYFFTFLT